MSALEHASAYIAHCNGKKVDEAVAHLSDDIVLHSPMGVKTGKDAVRQILKMMTAMPFPEVPAPRSEGANSVTEMDTPMGRKQMVMSHHANGLIKEISFRDL